MILDPLPATTNYGYWNEMVEYSDTEDGTFIDFSFYPEIRMEVIDPFTRATVLVLTRTGGQLTTPAPGIIEWFVGSHIMRGMPPGKFEVTMAVRIDTPNEVLALMRSSVSIVE